MPASEKMAIEVWSDIACPFCYIGKRRLAAAIAAFAHRDEVQVAWRGFQLQPDLVTDPARTLASYLGEKFGASPEQVRAMNARVQAMAEPEGIRFDFDRVVLANTFRAHQLLQLAQAEGLGDDAKELLMAAYFTEGRNVDDAATLEAAGRALELPAGHVEAVVTGDAYADEVRRDMAEARQLGIGGVPFFLFDRKYAISGAQPPELFAQALERAHTEWRAEAGEAR